MKTKNKKAVSLMVSYVLLIVIALGLAAGVYSFLKFRATIPVDGGCPENVALIIKDYNCSSQDKIITIKVSNKGLFNIDGFFIRASNDTNIAPIIKLIPIESELPDEEIEGRYDFLNSPLAPTQDREIEFSYVSAIPLEKIQIQPFIIEDRLRSCDNIVTLDIDENKGCS